MQHRRGKLRTKLTMTFTMLVAGPLLVTGLVLSLAGRTRVLESGRRLNNISRQSFEESARRVSETVTDTLQGTGRQLAQIGHQQLTELAREEGRQSSQALRHAGQQLMTTGDVLLKESNAQMITASTEVLRRSGGQLRSAHQDNLEKVSNAMIAQGKDEFTKTGKDIAQATRVTFEDLTEDLNEQRAKGLAEYVELFFAGDVKAFFDESRTGIVAADEANEVGLALAEAREGRGFVIGAAVIAPDGKVIAPGGGGTPPRELSRWHLIVEDTVADKMPHVSGLVTLQPVRDAMGVAMTMPVIGESGDLRSVIVADIALVGIQRAVTTLALGTRTTVSLVERTGLIGAHSDVAMRSKSLTGDERAILDEVQKHELLPATQRRPRNILPFGGEDDRQMVAYAPIKPFNWLVLVRQPMKTVLERMTKMESDMLRRADVAAGRMEREANRLAAGAVNEVAPLQERLAQEAATRLRSTNERVLAHGVKQLNATQSRLTAEATANMSAAAARAAALAGGKMDTEAARAIATSAGQVQSNSRAAIQAGLASMQSATQASASDAAQQIFLQSLLLVAVFVLLAMAVAAATASSIVRPASQLAASASQIARGDYSQRVEVRSNDEIGDLAAAFNAMAGAVQSSNEVLSQEKSRLQAIVESTPDGLLIEDHARRITLLNEATLSLLQLPGNVPLNQPLELAQLEPSVRQRLERCLAVAREATEDKDLVTGDTRKIVAVVSEVAVHDETGKPHGWLIHLHDVTHEREMDAMKSDFVSMVSHELRTPLTSILGFSSYLLTGKLGELNDEQRTALESMHRQSTRLKAIISDFLDISRIESGSIEMEREHVNVEEIASRVIGELKPNWADKGLRITVNGNGQTPHLAIGDEQRIAQIFTNLLGNAIKFTEQQGTVSIVVVAEGRQVVVEVSDTGIGIPDDELPRVFDRFYQVEKVVTRKTGGTGLGLAIVKNIVEAHGGQVSVRSKMGQGTTFRFTLAAATKRAASRA